ncbi:MAG: 3-dehydroquinate synthase [Woeseiaceae bacterium]|nr:3-dehydroquinate synthase [Gammaproteobacteria bacterium]NNF50509.1 3-dehydroquinate synthase [Woeseiaceae bacterium]NNK24641.1 3-dehydroquinate synthase [Woeseiaceae bacterium]NNL62984.1 3-dehydroquinate synthase [Woeseiaceae bacterium]
MKKLRVELGERSYPIVIGRGLLGGGFDLGGYVRGGDCLVVTNETVGPLYLDKLLPNLAGRDVSSIELPDGEAYKTLATMQTILDRLVESGANRDTTVVALGGGVVGDIAGFAAACYMRGVGFIQVPTTLLAQVDSSVGGKTGVNHEQGKNLIGAFYQPAAVLIDTDTLDTLPDRELSAGLAEVIKHGAICDAGFFAWLEDNMGALLDRDAAALGYAVRRSCEIKSQVVAEDERELGRRAILNFGHTFGHAIERCQGYGDWLHGEAVAAGMVMAARLSGLDEGSIDRIRALVAAARLPAEPPDIASNAWMSAMGMDKKVQGRQLRFVVLDAIGASRVTADYDAERLDALLKAA